MYLYMQERFLHLLIHDNQSLPCANRAMVTNNSIVIIKVVLIEGFLYLKPMTNGL